MNELLLYWVLPSLVTLLMLIRLTAIEHKTSIAEFTNVEWIACSVFSVLYPIGLYIVVWDGIDLIYKKFP